MPASFRHTSVLIGLFGMLCYPAHAEAPEQDLLGKIEKLEAIVQSLQQRLRELETKLSEGERPQVAGPERAEALPTTPPLSGSVPVAATAPGTGKPAPHSQPGDLRVYWRRGLRLDSADGAFRFSLGGRIHNDWAVMNEDRSLIEAVGPLANGTEFRRTRLYLSAELYDRVEFKTQYDFAGGDPSFKDVYLGLRSVGGTTNLRIGQFKEPFSLEELTSSNYISFMERSLPNVFAPARETGLMLHDALFDNRATYAAGVFRDADDFGDAPGDGNLAVTARFTGLPYYQGDGERLLHLGFGYSHRSPRADQIRFRQRPETHLSPRLVDTGSFAADSEDRYGIEAALVQGPVSMQAEYIRSSVDRMGAPGVNFDGFYVYGSFFLTGEHRVYNRSGGAFNRLIPKRNLEQNEPGLGAWEFLARFSHLDLNDRDILGGKLKDFTFGLNWYLNPNSRIMFNYVFSDRENVGEANIFQTRFQADF